MTEGPRLSHSIPLINGSMTCRKRTGNKIDPWRTPHSRAEKMASAPDTSSGGQFGDEVPLFHHEGIQESWIQVLW